MACSDIIRQINEDPNRSQLKLGVSLISHFGISRITLQLYHTKIKILVYNNQKKKFSFKIYSIFNTN